MFRTVGLETNLVFKSTCRSVEAISWLIHVQELARRSGFIVPHFRLSLQGRLTEANWTCETLILGRPFKTQELNRVSPLIDEFHNRCQNVSQRPGFLASKDYIYSDCGGDIDLGEMPTNVAENCRAAWKDISELPQSIVHGDLNADNLLYTETGAVALLDWDECRRDTRIFDTGVLTKATASISRAIAAWETACSWLREPEYALTCAERLQRMS